MITALRVYETENTVPYENLAVEEYLLRHVAPGTCILYLWRNQRTVVIGRNQNAWSECKTARLEADGGHLVRRLSGGGAVYHDLGNLNFTFLVRQDGYDVDRQLSVILHALRAFGMEGEKSGRNDITLGGCKFSGNAFYQTGACCYHHGTLLVDVDMSMLSHYLQVSRSKLERKGVASVRARVTNLAEHCPGLSVPALRQQLVDSFGAVYGLESVPLPPQELDWEEIRAGEQRFSSWAWNYGAKTQFAQEACRRYGWGDLQLRYTVRDGALEQVRLYSDGMEADFLAALPGLLTGCRYDRAALSARLGEARPAGPLQRQILADLSDLLRAQFE